MSWSKSLDCMSLERTSTQPLEKKRIGTTEPEISNLDMSEDTEHSLLCFSGKLTGKDAVFLVDSGSTMTVSHVIPMSFCKDEVQCNHKHTWLIFHKKHKCLLFSSFQNISSRK